MKFKLTGNYLKIIHEEKVGKGTWRESKRQSHNAFIDRKFLPELIEFLKER